MICLTITSDFLPSCASQPDQMPNHVGRCGQRFQIRVRAVDFQWTLATPSFHVFKRYGYLARRIHAPGGPPSGC